MGVLFTRYTETMGMIMEIAAFSTAVRLVSVGQYVETWIEVNMTTLLNLLCSVVDPDPHHDGENGSE